jgi:hypothetical protein
MDLGHIDLPRLFLFDIEPSLRSKHDKQHKRKKPAARYPSAAAHVMRVRREKYDVR